MATPELQPAQGLSVPIRLSPVENLLCEVYDRFDGEGMGAMVLKVRGRVEAEPLRAALANLQQRHPKLRARVLESGHGRRYFQVAEAPPRVPLEIHDYDAADLPWKEEVHRRFAEKMDVAAGPLLRVLVLRSRSADVCYLALIAHHVVYDGLSLLHAADDLLHYYVEAEQQGRPAPVASLPFVSCAKARPTGTLLGRAGVLARVLRLRRAQGAKRWTALPQVAGVPTPPQWDVNVFSVEETVSLVRRCREEKTSLDGAVFAAALSALQASHPRPEPRFRCRAPIDIRGQVEGPAGPVSPGDLGCFVAVFDKIYAVDPSTSFWSLARQARQDVRDFIAAGGPPLLYNLARFARLRVAPAGRLRATLHTSVIGVAPLEKRYGSLSLEECIQVYKNDFGGASINLVAIVHQLRLNLTVHAAGLQEEFWARFRAEMMGRLREAAARAS